jgi:hypothetical protein
VPSLISCNVFNRKIKKASDMVKFKGIFAEEKAAIAAALSELAFYCNLSRE